LWWLEVIHPRILKSVTFLQRAWVVKRVSKRRFSLPPGVVRVSVAAIEPSVSRRLEIPPEPVLPLTVAQYHAMIRVGVLESGAPIELLQGWLVTKMTKHPRHSACTAKTRRRLSEVVPGGWSVDVQEPVTTADSEPEPDLVVIRGSREDYVERHPGPEDVGLLVEISDASLDRDRGWKKRIYAAAGIPVYWIVNLVDRQVEVFTDPSGPGERPDYRTRQVFLAGDRVPVVLGGTETGWTAVRDLLP
jgi:Uma2 family endonuclease